MTPFLGTQVVRRVLNAMELISLLEKELTITIKFNTFEKVLYYVEKKKRQIKNLGKIGGHLIKCYGYLFIITIIFTSFKTNCPALKPYLIIAYRLLLGKP